MKETRISRTIWIIKEYHDGRLMTKFEYYNYDEFKMHLEFNDQCDENPSGFKYTRSCETWYTTTETN